MKKISTLNFVFNEDGTVYSSASFIENGVADRIELSHEETQSILKSVQALLPDYEVPSIEEEQTEEEVH